MHPLDRARQIARLLNDDPVAAGLVKEVITPQTEGGAGEERLMELLGLHHPEPVSEVED